MKLLNKVLIICGILLALVFSFLIFNSFFSYGQINDDSSMSKSFVDCLNKKNVVVFGFSGSPGLEAQLKMFGELASNLSVIDCSEDLQHCDGIIIFPSWKIGERIISSGLSPSVLSDLTGCKL